MAVTATRDNHGQSIAFAAARAGIPATIYVPYGRRSSESARLAGKPVTTPTTRTFADGIDTREPVADAVETMRRGAACLVKVSEYEIAEATRIYYDDTHQVAEGAGAGDWWAFAAFGSRERSDTEAILPYASAGGPIAILRKPNVKVLLRTALIASVSVLLPACLTHSPEGKSAAAVVTLPDSVHWYRDSAEQKAVYEETYKAAAASAKKLSGALAYNSWGVVLDIDETLLDNSEYSKRTALSGTKYDPRTWDAWVHEENATAIPGAREFLDTILDTLHGQVILVTNRTQPQCAVTEENLHKVSLRYTRILCDRKGDGDKNPRFDEVISGETGFAPVNVLIWVGDNIQDFPRLTQKDPGNWAMFGARYFALPNPMYGSWQANPAR